jgi:hypothetical protein
MRTRLRPVTKGDSGPVCLQTKGISPASMTRRATPRSKGVTRQRRCVIGPTFQLDRGLVLLVVGRRGYGTCLCRLCRRPLSAWSYQGGDQADQTQ